MLNLQRALPSSFPTSARRSCRRVASRSRAGSEGEEAGAEVAGSQASQQCCWRGGGEVSGARSGGWGRFMGSSLPCLGTVSVSLFALSAPEPRVAGACGCVSLTPTTSSLGCCGYEVTAVAGGAKCCCCHPARLELELLLGLVVSVVAGERVARNVAATWVARTAAGEVQRARGREVKPPNPCLQNPPVFDATQRQQTCHFHHFCCFFNVPCLSRRILQV